MLLSPPGQVLTGLHTSHFLLKQIYLTWVEAPGSRTLLLLALLHLVERVLLLLYGTQLAARSMVKVEMENV